jgi:hypothetical protein
MAPERKLNGPFRGGGVPSELVAEAEVFSPSGIDLFVESSLMIPV